MCTLAILRRPGHDWPVAIAANRDEMIGRPWLGPGRHWLERAHVTAGQDALAGGSWLGVNDDGVCAGILNRTGALGPAAGKRSRGELVLDALDHADAAAAAMALADIDGKAYRPFNLVVADSEEAFWLRHDGGKAPVFHPLPEGLSMFTARERNDKNRREFARISRPSMPQPRLIRSAAPGTTGPRCSRAGRATRAAIRRPPCASSRWADSARSTPR